MRGILTAFDATGIDRADVERFLDARPSQEGGTIRDQIAADMTNQLLEALGQRPEQSGAGVKKLREKGQWQGYDRRPPE